MGIPTSLRQDLGECKELIVKVKQEGGRKYENLARLAEVKVNIAMDEPKSKERIKSKWYLHGDQ